MTGLLFTLAFAVAAGVVLWRKLPRKTFTEDREARVVMSHAEMDDFVRSLKCKCGGVSLQLGEGPQGNDWRVVVGCSRCDRKRAFLFRIAS